MLLILIGKSGTGKDAIQNFLVKHNFNRIVTTTSRPMRKNEIDGVSYYFKTKEEFLTAIENKDLIEYRTYNTLVNNKEDTWYYGTFKEDLDPNKNYVIILDIDGAKAFKSYYESTQEIHIMYINSSDYVRKQRAVLRGSFDEIEWNRRLKSDAQIFSKDNINRIADITINNNSTLQHVFTKIINTLKNNIKGISL